MKETHAYISLQFNILHIGALILSNAVIDLG